jgi:chromodomain-helicase-DNA-binding protein 7
MELRKLCNHPTLIKDVEEIWQAEHAALPLDELHQQVWIKGCGKMLLLDKMLPKLRTEGHKVLIFSQMVKMLNVLEDYMEWRGYPCERLDGNVHGKERQDAIDRFSNDSEGGPDSFVFLLSTRAGGVGINLTAADTCIIYDSDWNPQNDLQAQARCHRLGQEKAVSVYRLVTNNCYEEAMFKRSIQKLTMDQLLLTGGVGGEKGGKSQQKELEHLIKCGAYDILKEDEATDANTFGEEDIDSILARRTEKVVYGKQHSSFSKATFSAGADEGEVAVDLEDPEFWSKVGADKWAKAEEEDDTQRLRKRAPAAASYQPRYTEDDSGSDASDGSESDDDDDEEGDFEKPKKAKKAKVAKVDVRRWTKSERDAFRKAFFALGRGNAAAAAAAAGLTTRSAAEAAVFERPVERGLCSASRTIAPANFYARFALTGCCSRPSTRPTAPLNSRRSSSSRATGPTCRSRWPRPARRTRR